MTHSVNTMEGTKDIAEKEQAGIFLSEGQGRLLCRSDMKTEPNVWEGTPTARAEGRLFQSEESAKL